MSPAAADSVLTGMGVVIDDHVYTEIPEKDEIFDLLAQIDEAHIPCVFYESLPPPEACRHFNNVAFILLDWELWRKPAEELQLSGVTVGADLARQGVQANIDFLNGLKGSCFAPVFIFSYLDPDVIKKELCSAGLLEADDNHAFIMIRKKSDLKRAADQTGQPLLSAVNAWIAGNPAIYLLSHWNDAVARSQNRLFWDFYDKDHTWPGVLWQTYDDDHDEPEHALADILLRNMRARMFPLSLDPKLVMTDSASPTNRNALRAVLETSIIVPSGQLLRDQSGCGDLFRNQDAEGALYRLNIRCDCDCIDRDGKPEKVVLYLLHGRVVPEGDFSKPDLFNDTTGFTRPMHRAYVFPVDGGKCVAFSFKDIKKMTVADLKTAGAERIGRLTAPHVTDVRQRYSQWLQREGLPKVPPVAVRDPPAGAQ